jgi:hypothetical protein
MSLISSPQPERALCLSSPDIVTSNKACTKASPVKESWANNEPGPYDVLCNRGRRAFQSIGNRRFRLIIENHADKYDTIKVRAERSMIVISIVKVIELAGGNFLKQTKGGTWEKASKVQAKEKVGHALRAALSARKSQASSRTIYDVLAVDQEIDKEQSLPRAKKLKTLPASDFAAKPQLSLGDALVMANNARKVKKEEEATSESTTPVVSAEHKKQNLFDDIFTMDASPSEDTNVADNFDDLAESTDTLLSGILDELDALASNESIFASCC